MKKILLAAYLLLIFHCQSFAQDKDTLAIHQVLLQQQEAWNRGNIPAFMDGYWQSDSLMFVGSKKITYGWDATLWNYQKGYPDTAAMGQLSFSELQFKKLSPRYCFVIGHWHLQRKAGDIGGYFTLLFRKIKGKWKIIVDHTA